MSLLFLFPIFAAVTVQCACEVIRARAYIYEAVKGEVPTKLVGTIDLEQTGTFIKINGSVSGLTPGKHGFHVHEKGDIGNGCLSTGGHFNPHKLSHGAPDDSNRHVGDLGNIETPAAGGATPISISDSLVSLSGIHSVVGRAFVVHEKEDDLGRGTSDSSRLTGDAGARVACGVIGISEENEVFPTTPMPLITTTKTGGIAASQIHNTLLPILILVLAIM